MTKNFSACAITGFGGMGKTRIMSEYSREIDKTGTKVFWFNAISADNIREEVFQFALQKKLIVETEKDNNYIFQVFKNWMVKNEDWLFLLDNVENYQDITVFFDDMYNKLNGKRHIVLTSRKENEISIVQSIDELKAFNKNEFLLFLKSHTDKVADDYAEEIYELLDGLPLALEQAAAYMQEENESYKGYFELLKKDGAISVLEKKHLTHTESVGATWNISMQRIKSNAAKELLNLCAFFAPDNIHSHWFVDAIDVLPDELRKNRLNDFDEIRKDLKAYSLVRIDSEERISIHRLLQDVIREKLKNEQKKWINYDINILHIPKNDDLSTSQARHNFINLSTHIINVIKQYKKKTKEVATLYHFLGFGFNELGNYNESLEWYRKSLNIRKKVLGIENVDTAYTYNNIANVHEAKGEYRKALIWHKKSLFVKEKVLGNDNIYTAYSYNNIGNVYNDQCKYDEALIWHNRACIIFEKECGKKHPLTATSYNNIAAVYNNKEQYVESLKLYNKALTIREKVLGKEHPLTASTYNGLAMLYFEKGMYNKSLEWYKKDLAIREKIYTKEHPNTADSYNGIALVFGKMNKYKEGLKWYFKAYRIRYVKLGVENSKTIRTKSDLREFYNETNNPIPFGEWLKEQLQQKDNDPNE